MRLPAALLIACLVLFVVVAACGDDDDGENGTPTPDPSPTNGASPTPEATPSPEPTLPPGEEPTPGNGDEPPTQAPTPTPDPAAEAVPAVAPADQAGFLQQFEGQEVMQRPCPYNPATQLANCAGYAVYAPDPPLTGQDIACFLLTVNGEAMGLRCTSQEPLETLYYEVS